MRDFISNSILFLLTIFISLLLSEFVVRQFFHPVDYLQPILEDDPILSHRISPNSGGHDDWGFRNYERPSRVDIVAIGDSQTYGVSARSHQSWPAHLSKISELSTYNMALGGYGPLQYLHLLKSKALELKPKTVIVGLYFGNDFLDSYNRAYSVAQWAHYRNTEVTVPETPQNDVVIRPKNGRFLGSFRNWMAGKSVIYRLVTQSALGDKVRDEELVSGNQDLVDLNFDKIRQTFTPNLRLKTVNLESPAVREGVRISKIAISEMKAICASRNIELLVVLIPTKELVYSELIEIRFNDSMTNTFVSLVKNETSIRDDLSDYLSNENISFVDVLPPLRRMAEKGEDLYPFNDGHPNGFGYSVIANEVYFRGLQGRH